jgi:hypothetical protein
MACNSSDLYPIENVWAWMKVQLKEEILKLWVDRMENSAYLKNLVEFMPRRLQEVIERGGNITHC